MRGLQALLAQKCAPLAVISRTRTEQRGTGPATACIGGFAAAPSALVAATGGVRHRSKHPLSALSAVRWRGEVRMGASSRALSWPLLGAPSSLR